MCTYFTYFRIWRILQFFIIIHMNDINRALSFAYLNSKTGLYVRRLLCQHIDYGCAVIINIRSLCN